MNKPIAVAAFVAALALCAFRASANPAGFIHKYAEHIPGKYIVQLRDDVAVDPVAAVTEVELAHGVRRTRLFQSALKGFSVEMTEAQALAISLDPRVDGVYEDIPTHVSTIQSFAPWHLDRIDQHDLPLDSSFGYGYNGYGVWVYVLDTGVNPIVDLGNRLVASVNFAHNTSHVVDPSDTGDYAWAGYPYGHGTHVADIIGGTTYGVAKYANIINVRIFDSHSGNGDVDDYIAGLNWAVSDHRTTRPGDAVLNMDLQVSVTYKPLDDAVMAALSSGMTFVTASGNDYGNACSYSPSHLGGPNYGAITVAASDIYDHAQAFANKGTCVDTFAPGVNVSAIGADGQLHAFSGTSESAPIVAGVAALYLSEIPGMRPGDVEHTMEENATNDHLLDLSPDGTPNRLIFSKIITRHRPCC